ncbi:MAG: class I adenylate cyclase [Candidatus Adiutrix sp.]|jgi:adenylate cyclase class 1|nr:class I adenylate cyclase [Candidatus Adiutrix sp.]
MTSDSPADGRRAHDEILANFIAQNANNKARIVELRRYATAGFAKVFDLTPVLLNVNDPEMPGYIDDPATPCGVKFIDRQLWRPKGERVRVPATEPAARPVVESLFLIGSSGSVGHNASSDLDYWVCYDPESLSAREFELLLQKLRAISAWALNANGTEAHFYTVNTDDLLKGRVSRHSGAEAEGEVAPRLLLEELYRTLLYVAGRPPVWQGLPLSVSESDYGGLSREIISRTEGAYIDLGFPAPPSPQELLAEALWLARKSEDDPFKGIIKMATLLDYVESGPERPLLCHQVKEAIFKADPAALPVDPYVMTIERVVAYGAGSLTPEQLDLLRTSAVMKIMGPAISQPGLLTSPDSPKRQILDKWIVGWGWEHARLSRLFHYKHWPERERLHLGGELLNMLASIYIRIAQHLLQHHPGEINPQEEELAPLAARLLSRMGGLESTVETLPYQIHQSSISRCLILRRNRELQRWELHTADDGDWYPTLDNLIYAHPRAARVGAWLIHNRLYEPGTVLVMQNDPEETDAYLRHGLDDLLDSLIKAFPPFELTHADLEQLWSPGGQGTVFLALNLELPVERCDELRTADVILRTGWGEMRHYCIQVGDQERKADQYLTIVQNVVRETGLRPLTPVFAIPPAPEMQKAATNLKAALAASGKRVRSDKKSKIDLGSAPRPAEPSPAAEPDAPRHFKDTQ